MTEDDHIFMQSGLPSETVTRVGIAIVQQGMSFLVGVRDPHAVLGGKHEFPGGKCFEQERPSDCAVRECLEETGLEVIPEKLLTWIDHRYDHGRVQLSFFLCRPCREDAPKPRDPFRWVLLNDLLQLDFPEANRRAIERLVEHLSMTASSPEL